MIQMTATHANITDLHILLVRHEGGGRKVTVGSEPRPATLAEADTMLAFYSLARTAEWDLAPAVGVCAPVARVDNRFSGTVAARLNQAVGTTHEEFEVMPAHRAEDGDLISDLDISDLYVVAGSRREGDIMRIHMVSEGKTWEDRYTTNFPANQFVQVARRKA
jgi:hypothetical protein